MNDNSILDLAAAIGAELRREGFGDEAVARVFALVREVSERKIGLRHVDVQIIGGLALLNGMVAEMATGEGKTLTATLAACAAALGGLPVHIITVNDYLASRDVEWMGPIYRALGLSVGLVTQGMEAGVRRRAYQSDITYCTNKEIAFDYLKDRIVLGREPKRIQLKLENLYHERPRVKDLILRGLYFAIVDEADSVLIDEAKTPLIISGGNSDILGQTEYGNALSLAAKLVPLKDYEIVERDRLIRLTQLGEGRLAEMTRDLPGIWRSRRSSEELVRLALKALHLFVREKDYLVRDGKVQIIDEYTGRLMPDRSWEYGLHQLIEAKEGCELTTRREPLARITYQRFFKRYLKLAGMTGTANEVAGELWSTYRLAVHSVPTHKPVQRKHLPNRVYATSDERWKAVAHRVVDLYQKGRPVLIGTRSVGASDYLSGLLREAGVPHKVLSARQDKEEADIVAQAGHLRQITVATNMAGRGTDIKLGPGVKEIGGLYVIATERHESRRIDRQLFGRCSRQGDPGTCEEIVSLEDDLVVMFGGSFWKSFVLTTTGSSRPTKSWIGERVLKRAQATADRHHARMRKVLLKMDEQMETTLSFSGRQE
jgi:preprotein translocase subunit SecA